MTAKTGRDHSGDEIPPSISAAEYYKTFLLQKSNPLSFNSVKNLNKIEHFKNVNLALLAHPFSKDGWTRTLDLW
jgi:hypothetical protein